MTDHARSEPGPHDHTSAPPHHDQLAAFLSNARWFGGKGRTYSVTDVRRLGTVAPSAGDGQPTVVIEVVEVTFEEGDVELYQVPMSFYTDPEGRLDHAFIGWWEDPEVGWTHAYDAAHDRMAMATFLKAFIEPVEGPVEFRLGDGVEIDPDAPSTLFTGEQSNSSVAFGEEALLKIFRRVTPGSNPDIVIHEVLTRAGSTNVAQLYGWIEVAESGFETVAAQPPQPADDPAQQPPQPAGVLQLAMLQQFLRTASDGWELALASVRNLFAEADLYAHEVGGDFAAEARRLGESVADIHTLLAEHFPTATRSATEQLELAAAMTSRLDAALVAVPALAEHEAALRDLFDAAGRVPDCTVQQVHGDLHLGQTLRTVKGWKIVDFEGEPAKPLAERLLPDSPWRDVAGMLRSFDYAPRVAALTSAIADESGADQRSFRAAEWSARNQSAFLEAYAGRDLTADEQTLLSAYVADKAVYECVYEARNRPSWVEIPLAAITQISSATGGAR